METRHETLIEKNYEANKKKLKKQVLLNFYFYLITELSVNKTKKESTSKLHD